MKKSSLILVTVLSLFGPTASMATVIEFAVMPEAKQRTDIWPTVMETLMVARKGDIVSMLDAKSGIRVSAVTITEEIAEASGTAARTTWLNKLQGSQIVRMKKFLLDTTSSSGTGDFLRYARGLELRKTEFPGHRIQAVFFGSPLQKAPEAYSMVHRYPADIFLLLPESESIFSVHGKEKALEGVSVHVVHSAGLIEFSDRSRDAHQAKIRRFFGMFIKEQGGNLASFTGSADHLRTVASTEYPKVDYGRPERGDGKRLIFEVLSPTLERQDRTLQSSLWDATVTASAPPPSRQSAPVDIGITWNKNIDLDIYVMPEGDSELFFGRTLSEKYGGRFIKDITSLPNSNGFETVTYAGEVPMARLQVYVNHYAGVTETPVDIEVRFRILGNVYSKKFRLPAGKGTRGGGNRNSDPSWARLNVPEILRL
jgi:hypothetical protein